MQNVIQLFVKIAFLTTQITVYFVMFQTHTIILNVEDVISFLIKLDCD